MAGSWGRTVFDPYRLNGGELSNTVRPQLPAITRPFHTPERNPSIRGHHPVDRNHSRLEIIDKPFAFVLVVGPRAGAQSKSAIVGNLNSVIQVLRPEHARHRAE